MLFYLIVFYPCEQSFDYTAYECGIPCYVKSQPIGLINEIIHIFLPVAMIIFFDVLILIRVIALKKRALSSSSTSNLWKQNSRMIMQLTAICVLTSLAWLPYVTGILLSIFKYPTFGSTEVFFHFAQATYVPCLGTPFFVLGAEISVAILSIEIVLVTPQLRNLLRQKWPQNRVTTVV
ncbi:unnamed protein product [Adineta steineri]|uniref:G-protein coupled receptors family 1 profile domain-containing protein n=1 Tax=Adineta steineri TaxID=433720 RepID=A0A819K5D7_9BILA|nr:unnamed protein product [Adineta steineri]CAF3943442.1 unnamed protein product [Adineta steineri]